MVCLATWNSFANVKMAQLLYLKNFEFENVKLGQFYRIPIAI